MGGEFGVLYVFALVLVVGYFSVLWFSWVSCGITVWVCLFLRFEFKCSG